MKIMKITQISLLILDSNNFSIGIHFFKVLVQIHYSRSPALKSNFKIKFEIKIDRYKSEDLNFDF